MDKYSMRLITSWLLSGITILQSLLLIQFAIVNVITFCNQVFTVCEIGHELAQLYRSINV